MAAMDYYNPGSGGGMPQAPPQQGPRPQQSLRPPGPQQSNDSPPYPLSDAPPPYSAFDQSRPHSQPPPQRPYSPHVNFAPTNNYPPAQNGHMPEKQGHRPTNMQNPQNAYPPQPQYGSPYPQQQAPYSPQQPPQGQQGYPYANGMSPAMQGIYGDPNRRTSSTPAYNATTSTYRDDYDDERSRSRSRSRDRRKHHHHRHDRPQAQPRKKSGVSTFLGAGGGALIGDAIFPGLGTLGGAILGGVGGHEYAKQRRSYSNPSSGRSKSYHGDREYYEDDYDSRGRRRY